MKKRNLKKGAAIELAILILLIVTFAGALLVSATTISYKYKTDAFSSLTEKVRVIEGAESVMLNHIKGGELSAWQAENAEFSDLVFSIGEIASAENTLITLSVAKEDGTILLNAEFSKGADGKVTVIRWDY